MRQKVRHASAWFELRAVWLMGRGKVYQASAEERRQQACIEAGEVETGWAGPCQALLGAGQDEAIAGALSSLYTTGRTRGNSK